MKLPWARWVLELKRPWVRRALELLLWLAVAVATAVFLALYSDRVLPTNF